MNKAHTTKAIKFISEEIAKHESAAKRLRADLEVLETNPPLVPTWHAMVASAWSTEGEPDWEGKFEVPSIREAVYQAMLAFCKKAGRVYPGKIGSTGKTWNHFDVQGQVYIYMILPNGTAIPVDRETIDKLKKEFNTKAPMPKRRRRQPTGLT